MRLLSLAVPLPPSAALPDRARGHARRRRNRGGPGSLPLKAAGVGALVLALAGGGSWAAASGAFAQAATATGTALLKASGDAGLALTRITVEGRERTGTDDILAALGVETGVPLAAIDVDAAHAALEALPWVGEAAVSRRFPGTLHVTLTERRPVALWQQAPGRFVLTDAGGAPIVVGDIARWSHLPVVVGRGAPENAADLFRLLNTEPDLAVRVKAATRHGDRRWDLLMDDFETGVTVKLPERGTAEAWARFAEIERSRRILANDLAVIDMRLSDRMIVRLNGEGLPADDRRKNAPDLRRSLPLPPGAGHEA